MLFDFMHDKVCFVCADKPRSAITAAWFGSIGLVFIAFIIGCASAGAVEQKALAFAGVWTVLLCIAMSIGGTLVMRRYQSPLAIGFFMGVVVVMANQCLILTAIFGEENQKHGNASAGAFATFAFFLFAVYAVFGGMLAIFRADLVQDADLPVISGAAAGAAAEAPAVPAAAVPPTK
jgi:hypothetical protein